MIGGGPLDRRYFYGVVPGRKLDRMRWRQSQNQVERYLRWWKEGHLSSTGACFDIGNTVATALRTFQRTEDPASGETDQYSAGNGSIMRLAPVPLFYRDPKEAIEMAGESSRTTHQVAAAMDACRYLSGILHGLVHGADKEELLRPF